MPSLDEIRSQRAVEKAHDLPTLPGQLAASFRTDEECLTIKNRFLMEACPACGDPAPREIGFRHGGIHYRCNSCTFEHTRKVFTEEQIEDAKKHLELLCKAAIRFTADIVKKKERQELYQNARKDYRRRGGGPPWTLLILPNGQRDAELHFGAFKDQLLSDIADTHRGRGYLRWMKSADFEEELMEIVDEYLAGTDGR